MTLSKDIEEVFQVVVDDTITDAEAVDCSPSELVEGLEMVKVAVDERLALAREEAKNEEEPEADGT